MELPYQTIQKVQGLSGSWQDKLRQAYKLLTNKDDYKGTAAQNLFVQQNVNNGALQTKIGQPSAPAAPADTRSDAQKYVDELTGIFSSPPQKFSEMHPFESYYNEPEIKAAIDAKFDPYFQEVTRRFEEDQSVKKDNLDRNTQAVLGKLDQDKAMYDYNWQNNLQDNQRGVNQNSADANTFFSGGRDARLQRVESDANMNKQNYLNNYTYQKQSAINNQNDQLSALDRERQRYLDPVTGDLTSQIQSAKEGAFQDRLNAPDILGKYQQDAQDYTKDYFNNAANKVWQLTAKYGQDPNLGAQAVDLLKNRYNVN